MLSPFRDVPELLEHLRSGSAEDHARPALSFYRGRRRLGDLDYAQLLQRIQGVADLLWTEHGVRKGDSVAVLAPNRLEVPVLLLAIMRLGAVAVPLNPAAGPEERAHVLRHSGARVLIASDLADQTADRDAPPAFALALEDVFARAHGAVASAPAADGDLADEPAVLLYTSGTTGRSKGVALSHRAVLSNTFGMVRVFGLDRATQFAILPLYHAHAFVFGMLTALHTRGHLVFTDRLDPFAWAHVVRSHSVAFTSIVPNALPLLLRSGITRERVPSLRTILCSSAPLAAPIAREFERKSGIPLTHAWGLSEYTAFSTCLPFGEDDVDERRRLLFEGEVPSVGSPLEGTEVAVMDEQGNRLGEGARGELCVRGPCRMLSYHRDEEATRAAIRDGWLRTGDEGFYRVHRGRPVFFVTGRIKDIVIRDGENYSPLALERALFAHAPELEGHLVVLGFRHRLHGEEIGAYLEAEAITETLREKLAELVEAMPVESRPKVILHGSAPIPRTHTGKVQRTRLQRLFDRFQDYDGALQILRADR